MPVSVSNQAYIFLWSVIGGMLIAFIYDIFRIKRRAVKTHSMVIYIEDFLYWIIVALVMFGVVYYSNQGEIRGYIFIGMVLGIVLYVSLLSRIIINSTLFIIGILKKVIMTLWNILIYPFKILYRIFRVPLRLVYRIMGKGLRKTRRIGRNNYAKIKIWGRVFKNIRKKF